MNDSQCGACATPGRCLPRDLDASALPPGRYRQCRLISAEPLIVAAPLDIVDQITDLVDVAEVTIVANTPRAEVVADESPRDTHRPTIGLPEPVIQELPVATPPATEDAGTTDTLPPAPWHAGMAAKWLRWLTEPHPELTGDAAAYLPQVIREVAANPRLVADTFDPIRAEMERLGYGRDINRWRPISTIWGAFERATYTPEQKAAQIADMWARMAVEQDQHLASLKTGVNA